MRTIIREVRFNYGPSYTLTPIRACDLLDYGRSSLARPATDPLISRRAHLAAMVAGEVPIVIPRMSSEALRGRHGQFVVVSVTAPAEPVAQTTPRHKIKRWEGPVPWDPEGD